WINDMHPKMVMHPIKPEMNGNDLSSYKDPNGKLLFVDFVDTVKKNGSGFVPYEWPKPGFDKPQPKLSYVVGFAPWNWLVGTGVYIDDLKTQSWASTQRSLIVAGVILLFMLAVSIFVARSVAGPLQRMTVAMNDLASGSLAVEVPGVGRGDEIGEMANAVEVFKSNAVAQKTLEAEQRAAETRATSGRKAEMHKMANDFEAAVGQIVEAVSSASSQLEVSAGTLTATAERAKELTGAVAAASEEASTNVQSVASATGEIGEQRSSSQAATQESVNAIQAISGTIEKLSEISSTIAAAVEEQGAATQEISRNVQQAATGTQQVSSNIGDVQRGASETGSASSQVLAAAQSLSGDSNRLKLEVGRFLDSVRAA